MGLMRVGKQTGFTIVELLIVMVVIGILAGIMILAFNGVQARAKLAQQTADLDKIGKAIKLWVADNDKSLGSSGSGVSGQGSGHILSSAPGSNGYVGVSLKQMLTDAGYYPSSITAFAETSVMLAPCTTTSDTRWVVLAIVSPAPAKSVTDQIADNGCTNNTRLTDYSDPNGSYKRNLLKAY